MPDIFLLWMFFLSKVFFNLGYLKSNIFFAWDIFHSGIFFKWIFFSEIFFDKSIKLTQTWYENFNSAFAQVSSFQSWIRTHQRSLHHPMLKCDSFFLISKQPQVSRLSFSSGKMINYSFQGKHEEDIKNAQDRRNIAPTVAQSSVTRSSPEDDEVQCKKAARVTASNK